MKTNLNLDDIRIASPCNARWEDMTGDERARFCGHCSKNVFNLSAMTWPEIESLIRRTEGKFCGRFYRRADGRLLTADCPTGQRRRRTRLARWCASAFASLLIFFGVRTASSAEKTNETRWLLGETGNVAMPAVAGGIVVPIKPPAVKTNQPAKPPREIMGKIATPVPVNPVTNQRVSTPAAGIAEDKTNTTASGSAFKLWPPNFTNGAWQLRVVGPAGQVVRIQSSPDLSNWSDLAAETMDNLGSATIQITPTDTAQGFFRATIP